MTLCGTCSHLGGRLQAASFSSSVFHSGSRVQLLSRRPLRRTAVLSRPLTQAAAETPERYRLNNLSPQKGARRQEKRKGRGYGSGQGGTCGFGMRGQKARSGSGVRHGFEGGQTPLFRQLPKLKGIAGGMSAGLPKYVVVNLKTLSEKFTEGEEVSLDTLSQKRMLNLSGREAKLPLKVLGDGDLTLKLTIKAAKFSGSAKEKIEAAGGEAVEVKQKEKWTRALDRRRKAAAAAAAPAAGSKKKTAA